MSNHLMEFRLAYLRAIAKGWQDDGFCQELLSSQNVFNILEKEFGFQSPWPYLTFRLVKNESVWQPVMTGSWTSQGPPDQFHIQLPAPHLIDTQHQAEALAAYYQAFPTLFGPINHLELPDAGAGEAGSLENVGGASTAFLDFGAVVFNALALSWKDSDFKAFLSDPESGLPALEKYLRFNNPWNVNIVFTFSDQFKWSSSAGRWVDAPCNRIDLNFPNPPEDENLFPIALVAYNNTGAQYPFTCDCL
ncbi:MAG: hypothetical protein ETSY1_23240 [Candidatus Entotheonella factor]|uniref:Uncharacterized protein n=1 Tax=Entotheonella factor TaxID=1429438 RepID=W4LGU6_ENTF1|nr:BMA_0021/BMA_0022 family TOMM bacteriocin [Candidatus Entotheonella palauensis]ETW97288.1 MAG: hypothetical protein ETSY1_23240 [Candidatus Entotheonella factor]